MGCSEALNDSFKSIPAAILPEAAHKFTAVIGLELQFFHVDTSNHILKLLNFHAGISTKVPDISKITGNGGRGGHRRTHQMCPAALSLTAFKISV